MIITAKAQYVQAFQGGLHETYNQSTLLKCVAKSMYR